MLSDEETIQGDPWSVLPIKTRKFAKECTEIVLSNRNINSLINFEYFENLGALWLNNNKLEKIKDLDKNFRLKILCVGVNKLTTLEGSLSHMKFLQVLLVNDNKLRNLDKNLNVLKCLSFLKNLNMVNNPLAEEPEYRSRVIYALPSLEDLDRHKITHTEKIQSEKIVKEFLDPLSKKGVKHGKRLKVYEKYSTSEKDLFREADRIIANKKKTETIKELKLIELLDKEKFPKGYIPKNDILEKLESQYYDKTLPDCVELDNNDIRRVFNTYDKTNIGLIKKNEIQYLFLDIKNILTKTLVINEKKFIDFMLDFYSKAKETCRISDVKKSFNKILHDFKSDTANKTRVIPDLVYLRSLAFTSGSAASEAVNEKVNSTHIGRNDIFSIKHAGKENLVILNDNKLQSIYK